MNSLKNSNIQSIIKDHKWAILLLLIYVFFSLFYGFSSNGTWDDDCPSRYFNTLNAFNDPLQFISVWNRPLFVLIFAPFVHLGRWVIPVLMTLISAFGAYYLYLGVKKQQIKNAFLVIAFLLFQPFLFSLSRNAETEPLSVAILGLGFYFLSNKKWMQFAIIGGLLPLARLELSVLLIFWAYYLIKEKQFKYILFLGLPTFLWNISGWILTGDFLYVLNSTIGKDTGENRYGQTSFGHYFQRFIYVISPVIYIYFLVGLIYKTYIKKLDPFIWFQFVVGFLMYVIFSWKLSIGNAAGFLRNLTPLSPLVALITLEGYNYLWQLWERIQEKKFNINTISIPKNFDELTEEEVNNLVPKKRSIYLSQVQKWEQELQTKIKQGEKNWKQTKKNTITEAIAIYFFIGLIFYSVYQFQSVKLLIHHKLGTDKDYINLIVLSSVFTLQTLAFLLHKKFKITQILFTILVSIGALAFTLLTEPPSVSMSDERRTMEEISDIYTKSYLQKYPLHVNHVWFFWANDYNRFDTTQFKNVKIIEINKASIGDLCIYETHYSHRLNGDVPLDYLEKRGDWIELTRRVADNGFQAMIYQKTDSTFENALLYIDEYIKNFPQDQMALHNRAELHLKMKNNELAVQDFTTALEKDSSRYNQFIHFKRGLAYFNQQKYQESIYDFKRNLSIDSTSKGAAYNIAIAYQILQKLDSALLYLDKTLKIDAKYEMALNLKWKILKAQNKKDLVLSTLNQLIAINTKNEEALLNRAQYYFEEKNWEKCIFDLDLAFGANPKNSNSLFVKGICLMNNQKTLEACEEWKKAYKMGNNNALNYLNMYCK
jgi:tetratricopeptide (TPR) repeat protein